MKNEKAKTSAASCLSNSLLNNFPVNYPLLMTIKGEDKRKHGIFTSKNNNHLYFFMLQT